MAREVSTRHMDLAAETRVPLTPTEALMRTPPFEDPDVSYLEFQGLATMVEDLEESLSDTQRELLRMVVYEKLSFREIARQLGISKSSSHRAWQALAVKLREILMSEPAVQDHLHGG